MSCWWTIKSSSIWGYYEWHCYQHLHICLFVDICTCFNSSCLYTYPKGETAGSYGNCICNHKKLRPATPYWMKGWMEAGLSHCCGHVELTHQKNMNKQGDWVKGKCRGTGFLLPLASRGTQRPCSRSRRRQTRRRRNPSCGSVSSPLTPSVCGASPIAWCFLLESSQVPASMAASLPWVCRGPFCAFFPSGTLSLLGQFLGWGGYPFSVIFILVGLTPKF